MVKATSNVNEIKQTAVLKKSRTGIVDKISGTNTVRVVSYDSIIHPIYKKRYVKTYRILADTGSQSVAVGDSVFLHEARLISKNKAWIVTSVQKEAIK